MKNRKLLKKLDRLDELTFETDMLLTVLNDVLKQHEEEKGISPIVFLTGIIQEKSNKIRALF